MAVFFRAPTPFPTKSWRPNVRTLVERVILDHLEGVGVLDERHLEIGDWAMHLRRPMTAAEEAALPRKPCKEKEENGG